MAKNRKQKKPKKHPKFWLGFKIFILLILVTILVGGIVFYFKYGKDIFAMQDEAVQMVSASTEETFRDSETTIAYNAKGKQIAVLKGDKDSYYVPISEIPQYVKDAFIVTEDKKFYQHNGVDAEANIRAFLALIKNNGEITQGASTITQQLARGVFLNQKKTYDRKIREIFVALELEKKYTKDQILEFYLNSIYFSNGYYGIEAAAKGYFSSSCKDLSLSQLCFLCSIPNNPSLYDPLKHKDNTMKRRDRILKQMLDDKVITQEEYDVAVQEKIEFNNFGIRKNLLDYDQVNNEQREIIYKERRQVLDGENMRDTIYKMITDIVDSTVDMCFSDDVDAVDWDLNEFNTTLLPIIPIEPLTTEKVKGKRKDEIKHLIKEEAVKLYETKESEFPEAEQLRELERVVLLKSIDSKWMDHIDDMEILRQGIGLVGYGQRDPVVEYKMSAFEMFNNMISSIQEDTVRMLYHVHVEQKIEREQVAKVTGTNKDDTSVKKPVQRKEDKVYPNDPCPCGSGKKYKQCCGRKLMKA